MERQNRFAARVCVGGETIRVHVPNSGRLGELLRLGARVYLAEAGGHGRMTKYDLILVEFGETIVSIDARQPPALLAEALLEGGLPELGFSGGLEMEVNLGSSRLDMAWGGERDKRVFLEAKSVTLVQNGVARFPDAPTSRGRRHLEELTAAVGEKHKATVVFVIQRPDPIAFGVNAATDPAFARGLEQAVAAGVGVFAYSCLVDPGGIDLWRRIPVLDMETGSAYPGCG